MANGSLRVAAHALHDRKDTSTQEAWQLAKVKFINTVLGYGFLILEGGRGDVHFSFEVLKKSGLKNRLKEGQRVLVKYTSTAKSPEATEMKPLG